MRAKDDKTSAAKPETNLQKQPNPKPSSPKKLSKKQSQWAWFLGLYFAGLITITIIAKLIKWAMGI